MIPYGAEIKVMATRVRLGHRLGEEIVLAEIEAHTAPDFSIALTTEQARALANQLTHPVRGATGPVIAPARWLGHLLRRWK